MDFWYKTNPNVLTSVNFPKERKFIYPTTDKYTFMFRITDKAFNTVLDHPYLVTANYIEYFFNEKTQKNEQRFVSYFMKKCSDTLAVKNPTLSDKNLQDWFCLEWEKVQELVLERYKDTMTEYKPFLGGQVGDENYSMIYFAVTNFFYDMKAKKTEHVDMQNIIDFSIKNNPYANFSMPSYTLNSESIEEPIYKFNQDEYTLIDVNTNKWEYFYMENINFTDNTGWIFDNFEKKETISKFSYKYAPNLNNLSEQKQKLFAFNVPIFVMSNRETKINRSFMQLQDLIAQVGGTIKAIILFFSSIINFYVVYQRDLFLLDHVFGVFKNPQSKITPETTKISQEVSSQKVNTLVKISEKINLVPKLSFVTYYFRCCFKQSKEVDEFSNVIRRGRSYVSERLDILYFLKIFEKFEKMKELVLTEDQINELEAHN